jgi:alkylation response protein AidB-like acyl-CoA dehydrogenase
MNFELSEDQKAIRDLARQFAENELKPLAHRWDQNKEFPFELIPKLSALGFMGMGIPEQYGGAGLDLLSCALIMEEVSRHCGSTALTLASHNGLGSKHILEFGSEAQKQKYLPSIASGDKLSAWALTEPGSGSDASGMQSIAEDRGDHFILNGSKAFITQGSVGDVYVVLAKTTPEKKQKGISAFILEKGMPGFTTGKPEDKLGCRGSDTSTLSFENLRVPRENLVGERDMGFIDTLKILDRGRIIIAAMALGLGRGALEESIRYAKEREQFGKPIADFQAIQWKLANMATELEAARLLIFKACSMLAQGKSINTEASMAKLFASEAALKACDEAIQIHGGYGYIKEYPVERYWRDCRICTIGEGTSEVQRLVISRNILKEI